MSAGKRLVYTVFVQNPDGETQSFGPADSDVPDWAREAITNPDAWADDDDQAEDEVEYDHKSYSDMKKAELEAVVEARNADRDEDDQIVVAGKGTVADLIAALEADDE